MENQREYQKTFNEQRNAQFKVDLIRALPMKDIRVAYVTENGFHANIDGVEYFGKTTNELIQQVK